MYAVCLREWAALSHKRDNEGSAIKASYYSIFIAAYLGDSLDSASEADFLLQKRSHQQIYPQIGWITGIQSLKSHSKRPRLYSSEDGKRPLIRNVLEHSRCSLHYPRIMRQLGLQKRLGSIANPVCSNSAAQTGLSHRLNSRRLFVPHFPGLVINYAHSNGHHALRCRSHSHPWPRVLFRFSPADNRIDW